MQAPNWTYGSSSEATHCSRRQGEPGQRHLGSGRAAPSEFVDLRVSARRVEGVFFRRRAVIFCRESSAGHFAGRTFQDTESSRPARLWESGVDLGVSVIFAALVQRKTRKHAMLWELARILRHAHLITGLLNRQAFHLVRGYSHNPLPQ